MSARRTPADEESSSRRDVLFVVVDCLRADHLSRFGYDRETTPFLDSLDVAAFPNAVSAAPWTYPSVSSLLTGLYTHNHGADATGERRSWTPVDDLSLRELAKHVEALPEVLGDAGYQTWCRTAIKPVEMAVGDRFDRVDCDHHGEGDDLADGFLSWWDAADQREGPRFGYVQFGDLHGWDVTQEADSRAPADHRPFGELEYLPEADTVDWDDPDARRTYLETFERIYDTQLRYVDGLIEEIFETLAERGDLEDTLVVVTGDHGEAFGEHADEERTRLEYPHGPPYGVVHGRTLFQEVLNVPLLLYNADWTGTTDHRVSTVDVFPTVLNQLSIDADVAQSLDGDDLRHASEDRPAFASGIGDGCEQQAVYCEEYKLIHQRPADETLLYDLTRDPRETDPLSDERATERLRQKLPATGVVRNRERVDVSDDVAEQLEDLGYTS